MRSNLTLILGEYHKRTGKRLSLRRVAQETGLNEYTVRGFANNTLHEFPRKAIVALCLYFEITPGDLLTLEDVPDEPTP